MLLSSWLAILEIDSSLTELPIRGLSGSKILNQTSCLVCASTRRILGPIAGNMKGALSAQLRGIAYHSHAVQDFQEFSLYSDLIQVYLQSI